MKLAQDLKTTLATLAVSTRKKPSIDIVIPCNLANERPPKRLFAETYFAYEGNCGLVANELFFHSLVADTRVVAVCP